MADAAIIISLLSENWLILFRAGEVVMAAALRPVRRTKVLSTWMSLPSNCFWRRSILTVRTSSSFLKYDTSSSRKRLDSAISSLNRFSVFTCWEMASSRSILFFVSMALNILVRRAGVKSGSIANNSSRRLSFTVSSTQFCVSTSTLFFFIDSKVSIPSYSFFIFVIISSRFSAVYFSIWSIRMDLMSFSITSSSRLLRTEKYFVIKTLTCDLALRSIASQDTIIPKKSGSSSSKSFDSTSIDLIS
mmetsp:Transcript_14996/g.34766  ORF Transcript_14996/g.34766 Transcript_14996/m.34766 type:complete len:246 (+) Transcript_14996:256-993(+)